MKQWLLIYSAIFILIAVVFLLILGKLKFKNISWWIFVAWGVASFELTLILQPPLQRWWAQTFSSLVNNQAATCLLLLLPLALISGFVQEILKAVPFISRKFLWVNQLLNDKNDWLNYSLAIGFGFAIWEAIRLVAYPISYLTTLMWLPIIERVMAIMFHVASTTCFVYGVKNKKSIKFYLLVSITHGLINYPVFLSTAGYISHNMIYYLGFTIAILFYIFTYRLWKKRYVLNI
ncbi:YhfC family intramembrane metalloprotease [Clostridium sp. 'deep sea']|uniref:YhfC family glutamic-type intramembrane protease n=1 Tax=Clostridium sp. 'deep sea' TaxID=2779445 RepID=UPI0018969DFD|nr:YhfC family glutamic-type intramembrane protease [Clostridium sp. 'deep sea']QOR35970.1 YhfC family intramembrane metalloprotease [Clostridium sp. 'deep sea']